MKSLKLLLAICLALPMAGKIFAKNIYKYQDDVGNWHFTDVSPSIDRPIEKQRVHVASRSKLVIRNRGSDARPEYYVYNDYNGPVEVHIALSDVTNILSDAPAPLTVVVPAHRRGYW